MLSVLGATFGTAAFLYRLIIASVILIVTLVVSAIWQKMVYTVPVMGVLLFLAAGIKDLADTPTRNLDEDGSDAESDMHADIDGS